MRVPLALSALFLMFAGAGCANRSDQAGSPPPSPVASASPSPSPSPSPSLSPTPSPTPPSPAPSSASPKPSPKPRGGPGGSLTTTGSKDVALTFDDGPYPEHTPQVLDLLRDNGVKATFCVIGKNAHNYPDLIRRIHAEGHTLCNHSWRHDMELRNRGESAIRDDLAATNNAIKEAVPEAKVSYFRAPGGHFDNDLVRIARSMGMTSLYWDVDTRDWEVSKYGRGQSMVNHIVATVQNKTRNGSIVLAHDNLKPDTVTAFKYLVPWLKPRFTLDALPPGGLGRT